MYELPNIQLGSAPAHKRSPSKKKQKKKKNKAKKKSKIGKRAVKEEEGMFFPLCFCVFFFLNLFSRVSRTDTVITVITTMNKSNKHKTRKFNEKQRKTP